MVRSTQFTPGKVHALKLWILRLDSFHFWWQEKRCYPQSIYAISASYRVNGKASYWAAVGDDRLEEVRTQRRQLQQRNDSAFSR